MHGLYLVWLVQERGFSPALVATILATGDLLAFVLEMPTGWVADRLGHRRSLLTGSAIQVCAMAAFWWAGNANALFAATLLVALGDTFRSGADQALLYRSCAALGREAAFQSIEARTRSVGLVGLVVLLLLGGAIVATTGYAVAWLTEIAFSIGGLIIAWLMVEPPPVPGAERTESWREEKAGLKTGPYGLGSVRIVALLVLPAALLGGFANAAAFTAQTTAGSGVAGVTGLVAAITLTESAGAWLAARAWRNDWRLQWLLAASGAALGAASLLLPAGTALSALALALVLGFVHPLRAAALQRVAGDGVRARIASLASACDMACSTLGLLAAGVISARRGRR